MDAPSNCSTIDVSAQTQGATASVDPTVDVSQLSDFQQTRTILELLFGDDDYLTIRPIETWIENGKKKSRPLYKHATGQARSTFSETRFSLLLRLSAAEHAHLFFGVCGRFGSTGYELSWQIRKVMCLWADIDDCTPEEALRRCSQAGLPRPSAVVSSGHGVHLYWVLLAPYLIDDVADPPRVQSEFIEIGGKKRCIKYFLDPENNERINLNNPETGRPIPDANPPLSPKAIHIQDVVKGIAKQIGGDHTTDLVRLLRMPGTMNRKDERNGQEAVPCRLVECCGERYELSQFEAFAAKSPDAVLRKQIAAVPLPTPRKLGAKAKDKLSEHILACTIAETGQRSDADFAVCRFAIKSGHPKEELLASVSGVGKFAERGETYFDLTWKKAEAAVREKIFLKVQRQQERKAKGETGKVAASSDQATTSDSDIYNSVSEAEGFEDDRPVIEITPNEYVVNDAAVAALASDPGVFQRAGSLVHIVKDVQLHDGVDRDPESQLISPLPLAVVRERLTQVAKFVKRIESEEGETEVHSHPPDWCCKAVSGRGNWPEIRPLRGIVNVPVLRRDGTIVTVPGYDAATGLFYDPQGTTFHLLENPTRTDAVAAALRLLDLISDFPHPTAAHRSAWLAGMLTPAARSAFRGPSPAFLFDANVRGCGKTMEAETIAIVHSGTDFARMTYPRDDEEVRKKITSLAIAGDPLVLVDNVDGSFGCASFDAALTGTTWKDRPLGTNKIITIQLPMTWYISGNNVIVGADTSRRICHIRLESPEERPELRHGFKYPNLIDHVRRHRTELLVDVLTILRGYHLAGHPRAQISEWGSYEEWSNLVRQAIVWCGLPDPGETREQLVEHSDREAGALRDLIGGWEELDEDCTGLTASQAIEKLDRFHDRYDRLRAAVMELCNTPGGKLPGPRQLGNKLKHVRGRVCRGKAITQRTGRGGYTVWRVVTVGDSGDSGESETGSASGAQQTQDFDAHRNGDSGDSGDSISNISNARAEISKVKKNISTRPEWESESPDSPESPRPIQHKRDDCQSTACWHHVLGGSYCSACWPPTDAAAVQRPP